MLSCIYSGWELIDSSLPAGSSLRHWPPGTNSFTVRAAFFLCSCISHSHPPPSCSLAPSFPWSLPLSSPRDRRFTGKPLNKGRKNRRPSLPMNRRNSLTLSQDHRKKLGVAASANLILLSDLEHWPLFFGSRRLVSYLLSSMDICEGIYRGLDGLISHLLSNTEVGHTGRGGSGFLKGKHHFL